MVEKCLICDSLCDFTVVIIPWVEKLKSASSLYEWCCISGWIRKSVLTCVCSGVFSSWVRSHVRLWLWEWKAIRRARWPCLLHALLFRGMPGALVSVCLPIFGFSGISPRINGFHVLINSESVICTFCEGYSFCQFCFELYPYFSLWVIL